MPASKIENGQKTTSPALQVKGLVDFARATDLQELVWEKNGTRISFRLRPKVAEHAPSSAAAQTPTSLDLEAKAQEPLLIKSTMVGTFYRSDSPDRPPLVIEGTVVTAGQPVAAIEAMKIMKDVVAPLSCRIVRALVVNNHPVEYGQALFEIELVEENV